MDSRADQLLGMGRWAEARDAYAEILAEQPDDVPARLGHGLALLSTGDAAFSARELSWVLEREPGQADARYNRALAYSAMGKNAEALADLSLLIETDPEAWYLRSDRGAVLLRNGQPEDALADLRKAVELAPDEAAARLNLGTALLAAGEAAEAHEHLALAVRDRVPGAMTALRRARQELYLQADEEQVLEALDRALTADSAAEVAEVASGAPYLLADPFLDAVERTVQEHPEGVGTTFLSRLADLRRLAAGTENDGLRRSTDRTAFDRLAAQQVMLFHSGSEESAARMAPALVEMAVRVFGPDSAEYGLQLANQGALERRPDLFEQALELLSRVAPELVPAVAVNYANSAPSSPDAAGRLDAVLPELGADIPPDAAARAYEAAGTRLLNSGQAPAAESLLRRALDDRTFTGAPLASLLFALAQTLFAQESYGESSELLGRTLTLYREAYGETHKKVADTLRGLGRIYRQSGRAQQAERYLTRAVDTWQRLDLPMEVALTQGDLAELYAASGAATASRQMAEQALSTLAPLRGSGSPNEAEVLYRVRNAYQALNDVPGELAVQQDIVALIPEPAQLNNLADIYYRSSRFEEAARWYSESVRQATPDTVFFARHNLANALESLGQVDEAIAEHRQALAEMRTALAPGDPRLLHTLIDVADVLAHAGQPDQAAELIAEAAPHLAGQPLLQARAASLAQETGLPAAGPPLAEQLEQLLGQARQSRASGDLTDAELAISRAIQIAAGADGPGSVRVAGLKLFLAAVRQDGGATKGVEELIREALSVQEEHLPADDPMIASARRELGHLLARQGRDEEAAQMLAAGAEQATGEQVGRTLTSLGLIAQRKGDFTAAERYFRQALDAAEDNANRLAGRRNLITFLIDDHRLAEAHDLAEETLRLALLSFDETSPQVAHALLGYTKVARELGRFTESEQLARAAMSRLDDVDPGANADVSDAANEIGLALTGQGKGPEAEQWFRRAADAAGDNVQRQATLLVNQAVIREELGELDTAERLLTKALGLLESSGGREASGYGSALSHLGKLELRQGKVTAAAATLTKAYEIIEAALGEHPRLAEPLSGLAVLYLDIGARDTAMAFAERAVTVMRAAHGQGNPVLGPYLAVLARCKAFAGDLERAGALFEESLSVQPRAAATWRLFAYFQAASGDGPAAWQSLRQLIRLEDELLQRVLSSSAPEQRRRAFFARLWDTVDACLTLAGPENAAEAWELVIRRLGQDADHMRAERTAALRGSGGPVLRELGDLRARLARAVIMNDSTQAERLRARGNELEGLLAAYLPAALEVLRAELIAAALPPGTTLVTYVLTASTDFAHVALGRPAAARDGLHVKRPERYVAFVATARDLRLVDLGSADPIHADLSALRDLLTSLTRSDPAGERDRRAAALREQLIDPLDLRDQELLIVASGRLGLLPFHLLPGRDNGRLIDSCAVSYLSAPRDVLRWPRAARYHAPGAPLVIADPDYDLGAPHARRIVRPLPGTADEGRQVAALLGTEALTGADATKISLAAAESPVVVHLATHGIFLPSPEPPPPGDHYQRLYMVRVPGEGHFVAGAENDPPAAPALPGLPAAQADPLLRSAVALAGLNTWLNGVMPPPEAGIGLLTADEACTLNLRDTQLVVLSACDTGLGDHRSGEGLIGLRWAFGVAGARAVVTSLWPVPDNQTALLMKEFYVRLTAGAAVPDALRAAQLAVRGEYPDPFYWAAFVVHGDPAATISQYRPIGR